MLLNNPLTLADAERALAAPLTPHLLAACHMAAIEALDLYMDEVAMPVLRDQIQTSVREEVFRGLFYRMSAYCKSVLRLDDPVHQQTLASIERSTIELYVDVLLLHQGVFSDGFERFGASSVDTQIRPLIDTSKAAIN